MVAAILARYINIYNQSGNLDAVLASIDGNTGLSEGDKGQCKAFIIGLHEKRVRSEKLGKPTNSDHTQDEPER